MDLSAPCRKYNVAVPAFNTNPAYVKACLESVSKAAGNWNSNQVEVTLVSDGSSSERNEQYCEIVDHYSGDLRVSFIQSAHVGIAGTRNTAVTESSAQWHVLVDSDDLLVPEFFTVVDASLRPETLFAFTDHAKVSHDLQRTVETRRKSMHASRLQTHMGGLTDPFLNFTFLIHCHILSAELFRRVGFFNTSIDYGDEIDFHLRCTKSLQPTEITHIPEVLYLYRDNPEGVCHDTSKYATLIANIEQLLLAEANSRGGGYRSCQRYGKTLDGAVEYHFA